MYLKSLLDTELLAEQRASNELITRIKKLPWIGMEDEAQELQHSLRSISSRDLVLIGLCETD